MSGTMCFVNWIKIWLQWIYKELAARGGCSLFWEKKYINFLFLIMFSACIWTNYLYVKNALMLQPLFILISSKKRLAVLKLDTQIIK